MSDLPTASTLTDDVLLNEALKSVAPGTVSENDEDRQLDVFMRDAVRELRWQLVELHKVNDHCEDFCRRFNCAYCSNMQQSTKQCLQCRSAPGYIQRYCRRAATVMTMTMERLLMCV